METKKYYAQDMPAALEQIKSELGPEAIIVKSRKVRQRGGLFGLFGKPIYEVVVSFDPDAADEHQKEQRRKSEQSAADRAEMERIAPKRTHEETVKEIERLRSIAQNPARRVQTKPPREERLMAAQEKAEKLGVLLPGAQKLSSEEQEFQNEMLSMLLNDDAPRADASNASRLGAYGANAPRRAAAQSGAQAAPAQAVNANAPNANAPNANAPASSGAQKTAANAQNAPRAPGMPGVQNAPGAQNVQGAPGAHAEPAPAARASVKSDVRWADNIQDAANEARPRAARAGITTAAAYAALASKKPVSAYLQDDDISDEELDASDEKFREHEKLVKAQLERLNAKKDEDDEYDEDEGVIDALPGDGGEVSAKRKRGRPRKYPALSEGGDTRWARDIDARMRALENMVKQLPEREVRAGAPKAPGGVKGAAAMALDEELTDIEARLLEFDVAPAIARYIVESAQRLSDDERIDPLDAAEAALRELIGKPRQVRKRSGGPRTVMLIGPTGVGKTTTLVKLVSSCVFDRRSSVAIINADVYRVGAQEQLSAYAKILDVPLITIYSTDELKRTLKEHEDKDFIFIDTCGKASVDKEYQRDMQRLIEAGGIQDVYVVVSSTSSYKTYKLIADSYSFLPRYNCILTKLDESGAYGAAVNMRYYNKSASLSYLTTGQNVPDDIIRADADEIVARLLG